MAEYINKADIETVYCFKSCEECRNEMCPSELFGGLPAIEIVHCENCIHREYDTYFCLKHKEMFNSDYWCADGEIKE